MTTKKRILKVVTWLVILALALGCGMLTGVIDSIGQVFTDFAFDPKTLFSIITMASIVLVIQNLILMVLNLFHFKRARSNTMLAILSSFIRYAGILLIICWGLTLAGVNVETVVASVGIIALVIGFGAESLIEDVITGLFMLFENQYNVDDIVEVDGFRGTVTTIGIRTTSLTDAGGNVKIINNSNMKNIMNRSNNISRAVAQIGIPYETDLEAFEKKLPKMMQAIYSERKDIFKAVPEYLGVSELADSAIILKFVVEVSEPDIYAAQRTLNRDLLVYFKREGVLVPYPQLDVHSR